MESDVGTGHETHCGLRMDLFLREWDYWMAATNPKVIPCSGEQHCYLWVHRSTARSQVEVRHGKNIDEDPLIPGLTPVWDEALLEIPDFDLIQCPEQPEEYIARLLVPWLEEIHRYADLPRQQSRVR